MRPFAMITTRHPLWRKLPMNLPTLPTSWSWMPTTDIGRSFLIRNPASSQPSTAPLEDTISCVFLWPCLFSRHLPEDGPGPRRVPRMHWDCRWHHCPWSYQSRTWYPPTKPHACCYKYGLVFNPQKMHVKAPALNFFGCLYDADGVHLDPDKVNAVHTLPVPTNITKLQEFLGMVTYLSPFIPGLSTLTASLHELLKKDTDITWNHTYDAAFQHGKDSVVSNTTLWYFDPSLPMTIQCDASQVGLGVVLLQNNKPIAFTSKTLTKTGCHYANIEREILAVIFGAERFRTCVYGRSFTIKSDHKPLESISHKNLADTPAQLQHMLLCLQGYNYIICYHPSKEMALPDTLSHFSPHPGPDIPLHIAIHHAHLSPEQTEAFQQAFMSDPEMHALTDIIIISWPDDIREVPHPYAPTGNIMRPSLLKMALTSVEKPSLFLLQKGREYYTYYTSSIKESPNPSCSCTDVSSGLV